MKDNNKQTRHRSSSIIPQCQFRSTTGGFKPEVDQTAAFDGDFDIKTPSSPKLGPISSDESNGPNGESVTEEVVSPLATAASKKVEIVSN